MVRKLQDMHGNIEQNDDDNNQIELIEGINMDSKNKNKNDNKNKINEKNEGDINEENNEESDENEENEEEIEEKDKYKEEYNNNFELRKPPIFSDENLDTNIMQVI